MQKVVFIISHPIQYYVPLLVGLSKIEGIDIIVFYTWGESSISKFDPSYNKIIEWDIPLLEGYKYEFLENIAKSKGTHHFWGIDNPTIIDKIKEYNPTKIVVFGWSFKSHLKVLRYFKNKVPIFFRGDSHTLNNNYGLKLLARKLFLKWVYKHIDYAISVGTQNRIYYEWLGVKKEAILFAPHAIENERFNNIENKVEYKITRKKLNIPSNNVVFMYCGSFEPRKNIKLLVEAKIQLKNKPCSLIVVGNGKDEKIIKALAKNDPQIHFIDFVNQSELPYVYNLADIFILPSNIETWGLVVNEAMASGLGVIVSEKVGCAIDLVKSNGFIIKTDNKDDLVEKMDKFINDDELVLKCKSESLRIIRKWSMSELINSFELILKM